jgi:hypothetical protein
MNSSLNFLWNFLGSSGMSLCINIDRLKEKGYRIFLLYSTKNNISKILSKVSSLKFVKSLPAVTKDSGNFIFMILTKMEEFVIHCTI